MITRVIALSIGCSSNPTYQRGGGGSHVTHVLCTLTSILPKVVLKCVFPVLSTTTVAWSGACYSLVSNIAIAFVSQSGIPLFEDIPLPNLPVAPFNASQLPKEKCITLPYTGGIFISCMWSCAHGSHAHLERYPSFASALLNRRLLSCNSITPVLNLNVKYVAASIGPCR